jgi:hypothetical protein
MIATVTHSPDFRDTKRDGTAHAHGPRLLLKTPYEYKDRVKGDGDRHPGIPGARWSADHKVWHVPASPEAALAARTALDGLDLHVDRPVLELMARAAEAAGAQAHKDPANWGSLPQFPSRNPSWGHQLAAYHASAPRDGAGLGMDMGTGKSKVIVGLNLEAWGSRLSVTLCPRKVLKVWPREYRLHSPHDPGCPRALPQPPRDPDTGESLPVEPGVTLDLLDPAQAAANPCRCRREPLVFNGRGIVGRSGKTLKNPSMKTRVEAARELLVRAAREKRPAVICVNYEASWQQPMRGFLLDPLDGLPADVQAWYREPAYADGRIVYGAGWVDEGHKIKSPSGKWSRFAHELAKRCARRGDATGTAMPHGEDDVYAQARFLDEGVFGTNHSKFVDRYFEKGGFEDREIQGFKSTQAEAEFTRRLGGMFFFCDAEDVLDLPSALDLPPRICKLAGDSAKAYDELDGEFMTWLAAQPDADAEPVVASNALVKLLRLAQVTSGHLPVGEADARTIVTLGTEKRELLKDELLDIGAGPDEPVTVFCRFVHDLKVVNEVCAELGLRCGEISGRRDDLGEDGRWDDSMPFDVMAVQLQAGGVGIDLTRSRYAIYYSMDFNLGDFEQSRKRVHRPGQTRETFYIFLAAEGTVDETIARALAERKDVLKAVQDAARSGTWNGEAAE